MLTIKLEDGGKNLQSLGEEIEVAKSAPTPSDAKKDNYLNELDRYKNLKVEMVKPDEPKLKKKENITPA